MPRLYGIAPWAAGGILANTTRLQQSFTALFDPIRGAITLQSFPSSPYFPFGVIPLHTLVIIADDICACDIMG